VKFRSRSNPIPLGFYAGGGYAFSERWISSVELGISRDDAAVLGVGGEYRRKLLKGVDGSLRFGYNTATAQADGFGGVALGGGLEYGKTTFDLAWIPYGDLGDTFRFSVLMKF